MNQPNGTEVDIFPPETFRLVTAVQVGVDAGIFVAESILKGGAEGAGGLPLRIEVVPSVDIDNEGVHPRGLSIVLYRPLRQGKIQGFFQEGSFHGDSYGSSACYSLSEGLMQERKSFAPGEGKHFSRKVVLSNDPVPSWV